ncbi:MAG: M48 family metalloprotease, partial [Planctomycetota bacterium]
TFHFDAFLAGEPNAFALPGGFVFISRSIVELCQWDEDEVAFILAHEMAHVIKRHAIERIVTNSAISMASRAAPTRGVLGPWLQRVGIRFLETAYSRDQPIPGTTSLRQTGLAPGSCRRPGTIPKPP